MIKLDYLKEWNIRYWYNDLSFSVGKVSISSLMNFGRKCWQIQDIVIFFFGFLFNIQYPYWDSNKYWFAQKNFTLLKDKPIFNKCDLILSVQTRDIWLKIRSRCNLLISKTIVIWKKPHQVILDPPNILFETVIWSLNHCLLIKKKITNLAELGSSPILNINYFPETCKKIFGL